MKYIKKHESKIKKLNKSDYGLLISKSNYDLVL